MHPDRVLPSQTNQFYSVANGRQTSGCECDLMNYQLLRRQRSARQTGSPSVSWGGVKVLANLEPLPVPLARKHTPATLTVGTEWHRKRSTRTSPGR
ncbi:hypothetical protein COCCADRAFT_92684 [Bipolaris zeicola 26-R-13]|uniref:Uncharacterized protein n=1 Tax=Cochliobolus carbonum (strain 26-R-13) TaxID=930089 RepID=W6YTA6_COCC2|nr:uncharacterized protein COCCADRAFT_92684 [Bipolaris zeicola 26-R-13]EUC34736.1 hypothetical protein COCCADRAFT_92684 [Bipolaris zeicola 26-R-13]